MTRPSPQPKLDVVVAGLGAVGSAALWALSGRGLRVLGIDPHPPAHRLGSSHGHTRIFRHAYFEHPDYVPLLRASVARFGQWEAGQNCALLHRCGVLVVGPAGSEVVTGSLRAAQQHGLPIEPLDAGALRERFPAFTVRPDTHALFEADAGFVRVEQAIRCALSQASAPRRHGVGLHGWRKQSTDQIELHLTDGSILHTARLVLATGAWTPRLAPSLASLLTVTRQVQTWLTPAQPDAARPDRLPGWLVDRPGQRPLYGIPADPERPGSPLAKVAIHGSDTVVRPDEVDRTVGAADEAAVLDALRAEVPGLMGPIREASVCLYTSTPDGHFVVDTLPDTPEVAVVAGLSGHGFKMAPALGQALADLATDGRTDLPVDFLALSRFG